jgi:hypothetical protein
MEIKKISTTYVKIMAYLVFYSTLTVLSLKSSSVSMNEPFTKITFNEITWQYLVPSVVLSLALSHLFTRLYDMCSGHVSGKVFAISTAALIVPIALSIEAIYGYSWDLYHHIGIR